jgi:uncharacterized membrane protein
MNILFQSVLVIHIITGYTALLSGAMAMGVIKGSLLHKRSGKIFFYAMLLGCGSGLVLAWLKGSVFLFNVGVFTAYQNLSGERALRNKKLLPAARDIGLSLIGGANGVWMVFSNQSVLIVFGLLSLFLVIGESRVFYKAWRGQIIPHNAWLRKHIGMMMGAYIGTLTAFLVVNASGNLPVLLVWLTPTIVLVPLLIYWSRKYASPQKIYNI